MRRVMKVLAGMVSLVALAASATDGRTWFGAGNYDWSSYKWGNERLWDSYVIAKDGGVATFGGPSFKGFDQNVSGLVLRGLDLASCEAGQYKGYGDYLRGYDITMTNAAFISSDCVNLVHPQLISLTLKGTGENTLTRRGIGSIDFVKPVQNFAKLTIKDGFTAASGSSNGKVLTADATALEIAGGKTEVRATGDLALGGDLVVGVGAGQFSVLSANLTVPKLSVAEGGALVISNGTGKIIVTENPADAKGRVDPRVVMRDWSSYGAPFRFAKYDATNGLQPLGTDDALVKPLAEAGSDDVAYVTTDASAGTYALASNLQVKALIVDNRANLSISNGCTLTVGDGTNPAGVIFSEKVTGTSYTIFQGDGTLDFGNSHGVIWKSTPTDHQGRGLVVQTRITGSNGVTFASRSTGAKAVYALYQLDMDADWTGPTYFENCRLWPARWDKTYLPSKGEVYLIGSREPYGAQLMPSKVTYDQHFHFSGYGATGANNSGTDGLGVVYTAGSGSKVVFDGTTSIDDEALFFVRDATDTVTLNGVVDGPGQLLLTGLGTALFNNAANTFSGGLVLTNYADSGSPKAVAASLAALGAGPVTVLAGELQLPAGVTGTFTNAFVHSSSTAFTLEHGALEFEKSAEIARATIDSDAGTKACTTLGVADTLSLGRVSWASPAGTGMVYATSSAAVLKVGDNADSTLSMQLTDGTGKLGLTKTGSGTVTLVGPKTYTGTTTVEAGTLRLEGDVLDSPSIVYWLDASKPETIDVDADGHVTAWRSVKGDYTFAAATIGGSVYPTPTYTKATKINGLDVVTFNNAAQADHEAIAGSAAVTQRSVFIVTRINQVPYLFGGLFGRMGADNGLRAETAASGTGKSRWAHSVSSYKYNTDGILYKNGVKGMSSTVFQCGDVQVLTQFHAYDTIGDSKSLATFIPSLGVYSTYSASDKSYYRAIGADICEVIAYDRVLTSAERERVENYLSEKWQGAACHADPESYETMADGGSFYLMPGATLDLHGGDITVSSLSGEGVITNSSSRAATLRVTGSCTFAGKVAGEVKLVTGSSAALKVAMGAEATLATGSGTTEIGTYEETIPTDSLGYWLDAGVASTIFTNASGEVTNWQSRASSTASCFEYTSSTVIPSYASTAPHAYEPTGLNGKPAVHFTATTQIMKSSAKVHAQTFFIVGKLDGTQIDMGAPWGIWRQDTEFRFSGATKNGQIVSLAMVTPVGVGDTLHINGVNIPLVAMTQKYNLGTDVYMIAFRLSSCHDDLEAVRLYNYHGLNRNINERGAMQWVGELICYERALSDLEFAQVEAYLKAKWFSGTGAFPAAEPILADGAALELSGTGGTLKGDLTLNGPFVIDAANRTEIEPITILGDLTFGAGATAVVENYLNLDKSVQHPALSVSGTVTGDFSAVQGLNSRWAFPRKGNVWSVYHIPGLMFFIR